MPPLLNESIGGGTPVEAALALAGRGWPALPVCWPTSDGECGCGRGHRGNDIGKAPLTPHGWHDASTDKETIKAWWKQWPDANVGLALSPAGLIAIDCDSKEAIQEAVELGLTETMCRASRWPAYIYSAPGGTPKTNAIHWGDSGHIDLLANGYLVVYGRHQNRKEIYLEGELTHAPGWAVDALQEKAAAGEAGTGHSEPPDAPPVRLSPEGEEWWYGRLVVDLSDGKEKPIADANEIDRSETQFRQGLVLAKGNASRRLIAESLAERDVTLGYEKYSGRKDDQEYWRIADKVWISRNGQRSAPSNLTSDIYHPSSEVRLERVNAGELQRQVAEGQVTPLERLSFLGDSDSSPIIRRFSHLLSGYPKSGKTELLTRLASEWSEQGLKVVYFTEEPKVIWEARLAALPGGFDNVDLIFALGMGRYTIQREIEAGEDDIVVVDTIKDQISAFTRSSPMIRGNAK